METQYIPTAVVGGCLVIGNGFLLKLYYYCWNHSLYKCLLSIKHYKIKVKTVILINNKKNNKTHSVQI